MPPSSQALAHDHPLAVLRQRLARQNLAVELPLAALGEDDVVLLLRILGSQRSLLFELVIVSGAHGRGRESNV